MSWHRSWILALLGSLAFLGCVTEDRPFNNPIELDLDEDGLVGAYDCNDANPTMLACGLNSTCVDDLGCASGYCLIPSGDIYGFCSPASCSDEIWNQGEVNTDCGGPCAGCAVGLPCADHLDCASQRCISNVCVDACHRPNYTGEVCDECVPQYAGALCDVCSNLHTDPADCLTCLPQFTGSDCAECTEPAVFTGSDCDICVNPLKVAPACAQCFNPRFVGDACAACLDPTFTGADCNECAHPSVTGDACDECLDPTYAGPRCDMCAAVGTHGDLCDQCNNPKHDVATGCSTCLDSKYTWPDCTECREGFVGWYCHRCGDSTKTGAACEDCADARYQGETCTECADGYGGASCRFKQESDSVLLHDAVGELLWADLSDVPYVDRDEAAVVCENLVVGELSEFRLPTVEELRVLRDPSASPPLSEPIVMPGVQLSEGEALIFWTDYYSDEAGAGLVLEMVSDVTSIHAGNDLANVVCTMSFTCGDGHCAGSESTANCPQDCPPTWTVCNDGVCGIGEDADSCPRDCSGICGDALCASAEVESLCASDCCVAACEGRACGEDGCGGSCGTCEASEMCTLGSCLPIATAVVGAACENSTNCGGGECVQSSVDGLVFSGGYCSVRCSLDGACPPGSACREIDGIPWCAYGCTSNADCRPDEGGYTCDQGTCWPCVADCAGKSCGDDGCGGNCGVCGADLSCANGQCILDCTPNCTGVACGDDGCGGSCGDCAPGESCNEGQCAVACTPVCAGKSCGDDGCGGNCGTCQAGQGCDPSGQCLDGCTPNCLNKVCGDDGCGAPCGACSPEATCSDDGSECLVDPWSDCTLIGVKNQILISQGTANPGDPGIFVVELQAIGELNQPDYLYVEFFSDATGGFDLADSSNDNYSECQQCFSVFKDYNSDTGLEAQHYFQVAGTVDIVAGSSPVGGTVQLTLTDLVLVEVTINPGTWESTPVEAGECLKLVPTPLEFTSG